MKPVRQLTPALVAACRSLAMDAALMDEQLYVSTLWWPFDGLQSLHLDERRALPLLKNKLPCTDCLITIPPGSGAFPGLAGLAGFGDPR